LDGRQPIAYYFIAIKLGMILAMIFSFADRLQHLSTGKSESKWIF